MGGAGVGWSGLEWGRVRQGRAGARKGQTGKRCVKQGVPDEVNFCPSSPVWATCCIQAVSHLSTSGSRSWLPLPVPEIVGSSGSKAPPPISMLRLLLVPGISIVGVSLLGVAASWILLDPILEPHLDEEVRVGWPVEACITIPDLWIPILGPWVPILDHSPWSLDYNPCSLDSNPCYSTLVPPRV